MPRSRRSNRNPRRRFFVACEGESEHGYAAFIQMLADSQELLINLDIRKCNGGDPLSIVQSAVKILQRNKKSREYYSGHVILLDSDRRRDSFEKANQADLLIAKYGFCAIWSDPTLEALLLKHLPGCGDLYPQTANQSYRVLRKNWPEYRKGMFATDFRRRLDFAAVERAAAIEPKLREFLVMIGLIEG